MCVVLMGVTPPRCTEERNAEGGYPAMDQAPYPGERRITRSRREGKDKHRSHGPLGMLWGEYSLSKRPTVVIASSEECQEVITDCQIVDSRVALRMAQHLKMRLKCRFHDYSGELIRTDLN